MTTRRRQFLRLCGVAGIGTLVGCSDSSGDSETPAPTDSPSSTAEPPAEAAKTPPETTDAPSETAEAPPETTKSSGGWTQRANFDANDGDIGDMFGYSVALSGDGTTAVVGAVGDEDPNGELSGSAYVFDGSDGSWTQEAKLAAEDGNGDDWFGRSVALSGDGSRALLGAENRYPAKSGNAGAAYVFADTDDSWTQRARLVDDAANGQQFGNAVALSDDDTTALVADLRDFDTDSSGGSADVFTS